MILGGNFGDVHLGTLKTAKGESIDVAVKKLKLTTGKRGRSEFVKEAQIVRHFHHPNIVQVIGVAPQEEPLLIILELCSGGSLQSYLKKNPDCKPDQLINFTKDACRGMCYLSDRKVIHRDLAARNCLLGKKKEVKISDFGLAHRNIDVLKLDKLKNVPIRWLSPETLNRGEFSAKTDVWSFGIMMWEIFSRCQTEPFPKMNNQAAKKIIQSGQDPMGPPDGMPEMMENIMKLCFTQDPKLRPDFETLFMLMAPDEKAPTKDN